ncbi:MAG: hypothetical protein Kow0037_32140 [Calditrichia bacterium]
MSELKKHLYLILYPNEALVASQLSPEEFGRHYAVGSPKHFSGKVIFAEVDLSYRNDYFKIDHYLKETDSGIPGVPKKTKFIKSYRVLEHIDLQAIQDMYLVTVDGNVLGLKKSEDYKEFQKSKQVRIYQEICPLQLLVASNLEPKKFSKYITSETESKGAPKIFFTEYALDVEEVLAVKDVQRLQTISLPNVNPANLNKAIMELAGDPTKRTKTISLNEIFDHISYLKIKYGFWLADQENFLYFPMPSFEELEDKYFHWFKSIYR